MKKNKKNSIIVFSGLFLLAMGLVLMKALGSSQGFMAVFPYLCIGLGCGVFGHGMGDMICAKVYRKTPEIQKQMEIEKNDERNIAIANFAKARAFDMMTFIFSALLISFALMGVDMVPLLLFVFAYLLVQGYGIYYRWKYDKVM